MTVIYSKQAIPLAAARPGRTRPGLPALLAACLGALLALPLTAEAQAPGNPNRPQAPPNQGMTPRPAAGDTADYAARLAAAEQTLRQAIGRSSDEPAGNQQRAMTPARMDMKAAAQTAYDAVRRAPDTLRDEAFRQDAERAIRSDLASLSQPNNLADSDGAAERILQQLSRLREAVQQRAARPGG